MVKKVIVFFVSPEDASVCLLWVKYYFLPSEAFIVTVWAGRQPWRQALIGCTQNPGAPIYTRILQLPLPLA